MRKNEREGSDDDLRNLFQPTPNKSRLVTWETHFRSTSWDIYWWRRVETEIKDFHAFYASFCLEKLWGIWFFFILSRYSFNLNLRLNSIILFVPVHASAPEEGRKISWWKRRLVEGMVRRLLKSVETGIKSAGKLICVNLSNELLNTKPEKCNLKRTVREEFMRKSRSRQVSALKSFQRNSFLGLNLYWIQNASFVVIIRMEASRCQFAEALGV